MKKHFFQKILIREPSWVTPKVIVKESSINGKGLFAKEKIKKGEIVNIAGGIIITEEEFEKVEKESINFRHYTTQIADGFYLVNGWLFNIRKRNKFEKNDFFNHSCDPNCGIKGQIIIKTMRNIKPGEELTFDYATTEVDSDNFMKCHCLSKNCRKIITGNDWKILKLQKKYKGFFSSYIEEKIFKKRN